MNDNIHLIFAYFDEALDEAERLEFNRRLANEADLRRLFVRVSRLHSGFRDAFHGKDVRLLMDTNNELDQQILEYLLVVEREATGLPRPQPPKPEPEPLKLTPPRPQRRTWAEMRYAGIAVAMIAALLIVTIIIDRQSNVPIQVATLNRALDTQWAGNNDGFQLGDPIFPGWLELTAGVAEFSIGNHASVILQAPCRINFSSTEELLLSQGDLSATVRVPGHDFAVITPQSRVVDLGTSFAVRVTKAGFTDVAVFDGRVQVGGEDETQQTQEWVEVAAGSMARLAPDERTPKAVKELTGGMRSSFVQDWDEVLERPMLTGSVRYSGARPNDLSLGKHPTGYEATLFVERIQLHLPSELEVEVVQPGRYQRMELGKSEREPQGTIPQGTVINSYLIHIDPSDAPGGVTAVLEITFRKPILGVIVSGRRLLASDEIVQLTVAEGDEIGRGIAGQEEGDQVILRESSHSIWMRLTASGAGDQVRIITQGYTPDEL